MSNDHENHFVYSLSNHHSAFYSGFSMDDFMAPSEQYNTKNLHWHISSLQSVANIP